MANDTSSDQVQVFYAYQPNKILPWICLILFALAFSVMSIFACCIRKTRSFNYMWPMLIGILLETVGYGARAVSAKHPSGNEHSTAYYSYLIQTILVVLAPSLLAASIYMTFGRIARYVGEEHSPMRPKFITLTFVLFDVLSFLIQGGGAGLFTSTKASNVKLGKTVLIVGFAIQIVSFGIFFLISILYRVRTKRAGVEKGKWSRALAALYVACAFLLVRNVYRVVEFLTASGSTSGYFLTHEVFYYLFEPLPILLTVYSVLAFYPGFAIPNDKSIRMDNSLGYGVGKEWDPYQSQNQQGPPPQGWSNVPMGRV